MDYGKRPDGTNKGKGFFGEIKMPDGKIATEISVGVNFDGKETLIPLIVPGLTKGELAYLINPSNFRNKYPDMPGSIMQKATKHAIERLNAGKSAFAEEGEIYNLPTE